MILLCRRIAAFALCCMLWFSLPVCGSVSVGTPYQIIKNKTNPIIWQRFDNWLMVTEDWPEGRVCYYLDIDNGTQLFLKEPLPGEWMPLGSAIKWVMYIDHYNGLDRLMAHNVDYHSYFVVKQSVYPQIGCGMIGNQCVFGEYRGSKVGDHYPVDMYQQDVSSGAITPFCISDSEKSQFAHDGRLIVYRAHFSPGDDRIYGHYFDSPGEFEVASRPGIEPSVCGDLVVWAEIDLQGYHIVAKHLATGEIRTIAHTSANPPCPEAGEGFVCWRDDRNASTSGIDIYGYDWISGQEFIVTDALGDQKRLRVCEDVVTWVSGTSGHEYVWGANIIQPAKIDDLQPSLITKNSVTLTWTACGTDSNPAVEYDIRISYDSPITEESWSTADSITGEPNPSAPGTIESYTLEGLNEGHHYIALKAILEDGTQSLVSNCIKAYVAHNANVLNADLGAFISFTGVINGVDDEGGFYCQRESGIGAVKIIPVPGQAVITPGDLITATGKLYESQEYFGPVIELVSITTLSSGNQPKCFAMCNKAVGGWHPNFGGTSETSIASNTWMLIKTTGNVSELISNNDSTQFLISDRSGAEVMVVSTYPAPTGLTNGVYVSVQGISQVARSGLRQIEVVSDGAVVIWQD